MPSPDRQAILCSRNAHKARELERLLPGWMIDPLDADGWPEETEAAYVDNARIKVRFGRDVVGPGHRLIGEDSGLEVEALDGRPGIESARYAPEGAPAIAKLLGELDGVTGRAARYVSEIVCLTPEDEEVRGSGVLTGRIATEPSGNEGFGYDPVFIPDGEERTVAELGDEWKSKDSHRARAARALLAALGAVLLLAGCGSMDPTAMHVLRLFFAGGPVVRALGERFPHRPGTLPCVLHDQGKTLQASCATDISLVKPARAVVTLTEAWNHGAKAHTWFFFIRRDGTVQSVIEEGAPGPTAPSIPTFSGCSSSPAMRPSELQVACGDGNFFLTGLKWSRWTSTVADATGVGHQNDCRPYCAAGHFHAYPVAVHLFRPRQCSGGRLEFTRFRFTFVSSKPPRVARSGTFKSPFYLGRGCP